MPDLVFPEGFMWGASTSSYQIEGHNRAADWWHWEAAGGGVEQSGAACDSWNRWREDIELTHSLGLEVYRISVEWSRVEPQRGVFDREAISRYAQMLATAKSRGLTTMLVLWHFTNPAWLGDRPWTRREHVDDFVRYVERVLPELAPHVDHWATLNEANTFAWHGYIVGDWPPGRRDAWHDAYRLYQCLAQGHIRARSAIKEHVGEHASVGITHVLAWPHAAKRNGGLSLPAQMWWKWISEDLFLDQVAHSTDWLGAQYYHDTPCRTFGPALHDGDTPRTDMGWRIVPEGLYRSVVGAWKRYGKPIIITENGLADASDSQRGRFILDHLAWLHRAISEGVDVRGYLHWSLLDNYEWAFGFAPRFGLVEVDFQTFERSPRASAQLLGRIARENRIPDGLGAQLRYSNGAESLAPGTD